MKVICIPEITGGGLFRLLALLSHVIPRDFRFYGELTDFPLSPYRYFQCPDLDSNQGRVC